MASAFFLWHSVVSKGADALVTPGDKPDGYGRVENDCGDSIEFFVRLERGVVGDVTCTVHGCANVLVCAQAAVLLARGKRLGDARGATAPERILEALDGKLPEHERHCAEMASRAVAEALADAAANLREPWRRLYRTRG